MTSEYTAVASNLAFRQTFEAGYARRRSKQSYHRTRSALDGPESSRSDPLLAAALSIFVTIASNTTRQSKAYHVIMPISQFLPSDIGVAVVVEEFLSKPVV